VRTGVYPGSFNPLTVAHLAVAEAAVRAHDLARLDLVVSRLALAKGEVERPLLVHRLEVLEQVAASRAWLGVALRDEQLFVDLAQGYDVVVMGADKWEQLHDPAFYGGSEDARDAAIAALPTPAVVDRPPLFAPPEHRLDLHVEFHEVSSTQVRAGRHEWMADEAAAFDAATGAWSDHARYERWLAQQG
jgi:nicotinic acid mononucleotide adenylyltransferase